MKSVIWLIAAVSVMVFSVSDMNAQDVANGKKVYEGYCKTCHQANGQGMPKIYPPLAKSDYIKANSVETLIREVVFGLSGKVKVNGKEYNGVMTPLPKKYTDKDVADVMTYVFTNFGNSKGKVTPAQVAAAKKKGKIK
ncbi:MAG: cytochrome c [Chlorobi bacterium]|nr:MAG: cytochrome c [Bacteroidota bacterium]MBE2265581.1 cytochrome c [Flavobacteriales bacterium]MBL1161719.1 cytochrome c [Chlorobiota bacterium]MBW7853919.1 cytochrome c [Candidatus Kapabacteria bacterium]MCC6331796.1 cytochrome c [Ignavibacteria bacterium]